jgi:aspartate/methionine/tyrosine aminotransferase
VIPRIDHLAWLQGRTDAVSHDLATSDLAAAAGDWAVVPESLADREDPPGDPALVDQLAAVYGVDPESVLVTAGATHANLLAFAAAMEEGDRVAVEQPGYEPLRATPAWLGAEVDRFRRPREAGYALLPERIAAACRPGTALAVATNRHNPSGRRIDREGLVAAAQVAADAGARLLVDEVYAPYELAPGGDAFGGPTA